ncbi:glycosyltransferase family 4 protein [Solidesulfovibrio sp.]|uniref:glycosyltransferase family 4 protein n=1 Tax=Solidesulfovibrio sp. TaxID=2910990 RepID=UPI002618FA49|nr:glycosyltransferase family 4 protein [Solidesulfovibrio sp.]
MKLLLCCEFYHPSVGGVQEVMRQLAERFVARGHDVTVATTYLPQRQGDRINGVKIAPFRVSGNLARGLEGEVDAYRRFLVADNYDAILVKAAQQWTFDAMWEVLGDIRSRKIFIPCGFSGLYEPLFADYFRRMPDVLRAMDHLIFYAEEYRDIRFAREHGLTHYSILPNGASEAEFSVPTDPGFRARHGIPEDAFVFLTVGSLTGVKGHREILQAFARMKGSPRPLVLLLNGNRHVSPSFAKATPVVQSGREAAPAPPPGRATRALAFARAWTEAFADAGRRIREAGRQDGPVAAASLVRDMVWRAAANSVGLARRLFRPADHELEYYIRRINAVAGKKKRVLLADLPRAELVQAFFNADLFVFASNIEYSPLVLYEAAAAGLPFVTVPVGNSAEIARWTGGGWLCPAPVDRWGYTRVRPRELARHMRRAMTDPARLDSLGAAGRANWREHFTWDVISRRYEAILATTDAQRPNA